MPVNNPSATRFYRRLGFSSGGTETTPNFFVDEAGASRFAGTVSFAAQVNFENILRITGDAIRLPFGSAATPSLSFDGDTNLGLYRSAADQLSFSIAGAEGFRITADSQALGVNGTAALPSFGFINSNTTGLFRLSDGALGFSVTGTERVRFTPDPFLAMASTVQLAWTTGALGTAADVVLVRDAANVLAQRNGTTAQAFNVYETFTDASNYGRGRIAMESSLFNIAAQAAGTGTARAIRFETNGSGRMDVTTAGHLVPVTDNAPDLGTTALRFRTGYLGTSLSIGIATNASEDLFVGTDADSIIRVNTANATATTTGYVQFERSRGTQASRTNVVSGDAIGILTARPYSGATGYWDTADMRFAVDGAVTDNQRPASRFEFRTNLANATAVEQLRLDASGDLSSATGTNWLIGAGVGTNANSGTNQLSVSNGTAPTAAAADSVVLYSTDNTAGNTIPSFYCEGTGVIATGQVDSTSTVRVLMRINGTVVTLLAI